MQLQEIIDVAPDGKTAKARFRGMVQLSRAHQSGEWGDGDYENEYVKQNGVWKIAKLHFYADGFTDYDAGLDQVGHPPWRARAPRSRRTTRRPKSTAASRASTSRPTTTTIRLPASR